MLLGFRAHFSTHGLFGQIQELLPVFCGFPRFIASLIDGGTPVVDQRLLFIRLRQGFGLIELQKSTAVPFLQQVQPEDRQMRIKGIGVIQQDTVDVFISLIASLQLYVR